LFELKFEKHMFKFAPIETIDQEILNEKVKYLVAITSRLYFLYRANGNVDCKYYSMDLPFKYAYAFQVMKYYCFLDEMNKMNQNLMKSGLHKPIYNKYSKPNLCKQSKVWYARRKMLSVMISHFMVLLVGHLAGFGVFLVEVIRRRS